VALHADEGTVSETAFRLSCHGEIEACRRVRESAAAQPCLGATRF